MLSSRSTLGEAWCRARNRVLRNPDFQRWSASFPLTRFIAKKRATALFDLCAGFVYSQVLTACVEVGVLDVLGQEEHPREASDLAGELGLSLEATLRLLEAATGLGILERLSDGRYTLGIHGAALIGNPSVFAMVKHHRLLYRDLSDPVALLRRGADDADCPQQVRQFWSYARAADGGGGGDVAPYSELMASSLSLIADDILEAYPQKKHRHLLDVAGGEGAFLEHSGTRHPELTLSLFDLPGVADRARARLSRAGLLHRANVVGGDLFRDPLPGGADLATLLRVIHDHDDPAALHILKSVKSALVADGVLLLAEPMAATPGVERMGAAYFGFYLLAMGQGRPRTEKELRALLHEAGFRKVRSQRTRRPILSSLLVASVN